MNCNISFHRRSHLGAALLFFNLIVPIATAQDSGPNRDGVFRYDIINLTTRTVSVADGRQINRRNGDRVRHGTIDRRPDAGPTRRQPNRRPVRANRP